MLYDFRFPRPTLTEFCFRFMAYPQAGLPDESPVAQGEVQVWIFISERWYGPYSVGLRGQRRAVALNVADLNAPERIAMHEAIYTCKHRLMEVQRLLGNYADTITGNRLISEYTRLYPFTEPTPAYDLVRA